MAIKNIVVSGYFSGENNTDKLRWFEQLNERVRPDGSRIVLFYWDTYRPQTHLRCTPVGRDIMKSHRGYKLPNMGVFPSNSHVRWAARLEALTRRCGDVKARAKLHAYAIRCSEVIAKYNPYCMVLWHQMNPLHLTLEGICWSLGIPVLYAEHGVLPGSICIEPHGQMGASLPAKLQFSTPKMSQAALDNADAYLCYVRENKLTRKAQPTKPIPEFKTSKPIIFYAGQNDYAAGICPPGAPWTYHHTSAGLNSTKDGLNRLLDIGKYHIIFKPHPCLRTSDTDGLRVGTHGDLTYAPESSIFDCIEASDITATIVSQTAYHALIMGKPVCLMGNTQLSRADCTMRSIAEIRQPPPVDAFRNHVAFCLERYVHAFSNEMRGYMREYNSDTIQKAVSRLYDGI